MPLAIVVVAKGSRWRSITAWSRRGFLRRMADEPSTATGRRAAPRSSPARIIDAFGAAGRGRPAGMGGTDSLARASATSSGKSRWTGPSGSLRAISSASARTEATAPSRSARLALVIGRKSV